MKKSAILLFSSVLLLFSCVKEEKRWIPLPESTKNGQNTFGCYVNNTPYIVEGYRRVRGMAILSSTPPPGVVRYFEPCPPDTFICFGVEAGVEKRIKFRIRLSSSAMYYDINKIVLDSNAFHVYSEFTEGYELDKSKSNWIEFTKLDDYAYSGFFDLHFINAKGNKVRFEDGRFDIGNK